MWVVLFELVELVEVALFVGATSVTRIRKLSVGPRIAKSDLAVDDVGKSVVDDVDFGDVNVSDKELASIDAPGCVVSNYVVIISLLR